MEGVPEHVSEQLIGRARELARIEAYLDDAVTGRGRLVLCTGDAGIGKTGLAEEVAGNAVARGIAVVWARATDLDSTPPYGRWRLALATPGAAGLDLWSEVFERAARPTVSEGLNAGEHRFALFAEVLRRLVVAAEGSGLLLVLDDLQWADPASMALLIEVVRQLLRTHILIVATYRASAAPAANGDAVLHRQLFSEPDAGSDLAGLSTRADKHGDVYVVSGQEVWSSHAQFADWGIALVRTDPKEPRTKGISMLAIPMRSKGVIVRPLRQMTGEAEFNEVFLDEVEVPVENLIGPENEGWRVANATLGNERGRSFIWKEQMRHEVAIDLFYKAGAGAGLLGDPLVSQRLARTWMDPEIFGCTTRERSLVSAVGGDRPRVEPRETLLGSIQPAVVRDCLRRPRTGGNAHGRRLGTACCRPAPTRSWAVRARSSATSSPSGSSAFPGSRRSRR